MNNSNNPSQPTQPNFCKYCGEHIHNSVSYCDEHCREMYERNGSTQQQGGEDAVRAIIYPNSHDTSEGLVIPFEKIHDVVAKLAALTPPVEVKDQQPLKEDFLKNLHEWVRILAHYEIDFNRSMPVLDDMREYLFKASKPPTEQLLKKRLSQGDDSCLNFLEQPLNMEESKKEEFLLDIDMKLAQIEDYSHGEEGRKITEIRGLLQKYQKL